ncbi:hypothetical protein APHAL10511_004866 [Amanita phalloides]|nr:hypothetical protein APHAL10511_004866 [Amanita phalloides]
MSNPASQSRLSVDLGVGKKLGASRIRHNPPRLQHSPSLPNIWFPPHSGPLPSQIIDSSRNPLQRPSTPPPNMVTPVTHREAAPDNNVVYELSDGATPPVINGERTQGSSKKDKRQPDSDALHPLLTPPLTPSSSIVTRSDSVGTRDNDTQATSSAEEGESESEAGRFLLVSNVARRVHPDILRTAIIASLRDARIGASPEENFYSLPVKKLSSSPVEDIVKGIFVRRQESHGIIMLAFYDVRYARFAKSVLSVRTSGVLADCVDKNLSGGEAHAWLTCRFITAEELIKTIGNSAFLASTYGIFYIIVECEEYHGAEHETDRYFVPSNGNASVYNPNTETSDKAYKPNLGLLKKYLESFGDLRYFIPADISAGKVDDKDRVKYFRVEYFDTREADNASSELDGQVIFGMRLKVYRCEVPNAALPLGSMSGNHDEQAPPVKRETDPTSSPHNDHPRCSDKFCIALPGQLSRTRERFPFDGQATTMAEANGPHKPTVTAYSPTRNTDAASPTYFYTSHPGNFFSPTMREVNGHTDIGGVNNYVVPGVVNTPSPAKNDHERGPMLSGENGNHDLRYWNGDYQNAAYHFYYARPDCFCCPQKDSTSNGCASAPMTSSSTVFYAPFQSTVPPGMVYPVPQQVTSAYGFEHESGQIQHPMGMHNWGLDHATAIAAAGPIPAHVSLIPSPEHWFADSHASLVGGCRYYPPQIPNAQNCHIPYYPNVPFGPQVTPTSSSSLPIPTERTPSPLPHVCGPASAVSQAISSVPRESAPLPERNQLNLARIEDGQDTRTTVMIKNIPNKMSDRDLLNFIHKVCPRRIDFLYLRMDFKNGCNVGYAFVNFIHVQDLLAFAKKKLGEKWNMFSSEKVLQMSYANYQGKEALVEKFKNSCIMDEREAWRPKIFYSDGPEQGLPEPFPAPTHLRRKERSSHNRGALWPRTYRRMPSDIFTGSSLEVDEMGFGTYRTGWFQSGVAKHKDRLESVFLKAVLAGVMLSFGGILFQIANASPGLLASNPGLLKILAAFVFPAGLVMIVLQGQELLTSNMMIFPMAVLKGAIPWWSLLLNWFIVFWGNLVGSLFVAEILVHYSGIVSAQPYRSAIQSFAVRKVNDPHWHQIFLRGIGCNWLVCVAIWLGMGARDTVSKVYVLWFPIWIFVACGFDHVVANMFSIPLGIALGADLTVAQYIRKSLFASLFGNIVGGLVVALPATYFYLIDWNSHGMQAAEQGEMASNNSMGTIENSSDRTGNKATQ